MMEKGWVGAVMLKECMASAATRCAGIARSEQVMGYRESACTYLDMAWEIDGLIPWVLARVAEGYMRELEDSGELIR